MITKKITTFLMFIALATTTINAQIGGFINKARNKASEIKTLTNRAGEVTESIPKNKNKSNNGNNTLNQIKETTGKAAETGKFELAGETGYDEIPLKYNIEMLDREKPIGPYRHIRKAGEKGNFHFARDYRELDGIAEPEIKNAMITFSSTPFKDGTGTPAKTFNSSANSHIYARLETKGSSIKDALKISGNGLKLTVDFYLYPVGSDAIKDRPGLGTCTIFLMPEHVSRSILDFDIKPALNSVLSYFDPSDRYAFYIPYFSLMHSPEFFKSSGKYMVGVRLVSDLKDEWGNVTGKKQEVMGSFEYDMNVSDAKTVFDEGQAVLKKLQGGMRTLPKPMPKEWNMASAASVVPGYNIAKYNQLYMNFYKNVKIVKTVLKPVAGTTWKVISNDNIIPTYKYCTQTVYFFVKDNEGNCYYHPCDLRQDYSGGGTYGPTHLAVFDEERVYIKCDEMK